MAASRKEAVVIILDVGRSSKLIDDDESFYEKSLSCASMIIQRKIFSLSKDEIGLILVGTKEKDNSLDYDNISVPFPLALSSWDLVEYLNKSVGSSNVDGDWLDGIVIALQFLKDETENKKFVGKHIVLFTNCASAVSDNQVDTIMKGMKNIGVELTVIGPDVISQSHNSEGDSTDEENSNEPNYDPVAGNTQKPKSMEQEAGEALLAKIITQVGGVICSFEEAIPQLTLFQKKTIKPSPWNVEMTIGPDIRIPVSGYRMVTN